MYVSKFIIFWASIKLIFCSFFSVNKKTPPIWRRLSFYWFFVDSTGVSVFADSTGEDGAGSSVFCSVVEINS